MSENGGNGGKTMPETTHLGMDLYHIIPPIVKLGMVYYCSTNITYFPYMAILIGGNHDSP